MPQRLASHGSVTVTAPCEHLERHQHLCCDWNISWGILSSGSTADVSLRSVAKRPEENNFTVETVQAAAKRYKVTGSGKVMRRKPGKQHINEKMSPGHLRRLGKEVQVNTNAT